MRLDMVLHGVADVDPVARDTARSYRLRPLSRVARLIWPTALPYVVTGVRLATAVALVLTITGELVIGTPGLGNEIATAQTSGAVPAILAGGSATVTLSWDTLGAAGFHLVYAVVDRDGAVAETDEGNNDNLGRVELAAATTPDLHLESLTIDPSRVSAGTSVELVATVANRGATLASSYDVVFRANGIEVGRRSSPAATATSSRCSDLGSVEDLTSTSTKPPSTRSRMSTATYTESARKEAS